MVKRIARAVRLRAARVQPLLGHLQVVVRQLRPEKELRFALGRGVIVGLEQRRGALDELLHARQNPAVGRRELRLVHGSLRRTPIGQESAAKARHVPQLRRQPRPGLDLLLADDRILAQPRAGGPVAHRVGRILFDHRQGRHRPAAAALADFARPLRRQPPAGDGHVAPGQGVEMAARLDDGVKSPGADNLVRLRAQREGEDARVQRRVAQPAARDLGRERGGGPGVHHVLLRREGGSAARGAGRLGRRIRGVERQIGRVGQHDFPAAVASPERERHAEDALARDAPVPIQILHPLLVARPHVGRAPLHRFPGRQQFRLEIQHAYKPLRRHDVFHRRVAALVDAHGLRCFFLPQQQAALRQDIDDARARLRRGEAGERPGGGGHTAVSPNRLHQRQLVRVPPRYVRLVAEGAAHHRARPLGRVGGRVGQDGHALLKERNLRLLADKMLEALVLRVHKDRHARRQQLRPRGGDGQRGAVRQPEGQRDEGRFPLQVVQIRLGDGRPALRAPDGGRHLPVGQPLRDQVKERKLRAAARVGVDGAVGVAPINRQPQPPPQPLVSLFGLRADGQAVGDERLAPHCGGGDAQPALHQPLGGQPVVVIAHGVEDVVAAHAPEARQEVGVAVGVDVAQVQLARHGRRRRVDAEDRGVALPVEMVDAGRLPLRLQVGFGRVGVITLR